MFDEGSKSLKNLKKGMRVVVGRGDRAKFWFEIQCDSIQLKLAFSRIFVKVIHNPRASNSFADMLAKKGSNNDGGFLVLGG